MNNLSSSPALSIQEIGDYFVQAFPAATKDEQTLALALYRLLSLGKPVNISQLQTEVSLTASAIEQILHDWPSVFFNNAQQVIGFWGMAVQATTHQLLVDKNVCYAWCAWDMLFIPQLLNKVVHIESNCPATNNTIKLIVSPTDAKSTNGKPLYVSFLQPDMDKLNDDITGSFCRFVYFFDSKIIAEQWLAKRPNTFLLTLEAAFEIAKHVNNRRFNLTLDKGK